MSLPARICAKAVWRSYKNVALLGRDNEIRVIDLGLVHSSSADSMAALILGRLRQEDEAVEGVNPNFLIRNWPPAITEWSIRAVRDAFDATEIAAIYTASAAPGYTVSRFGVLIGRVY